VRRSADARSLQLFLEQREDAVLTRTELGPSEVRTMWSGVQARHEGPRPVLSYLADPAPDDLGRVASAAVAGMPGPTPRATDGPRPWTVPSSEGDSARAIVENMTARVAGSASAGWSVTAVTFEQRIWVADRELGCREDRRRSARLRVELRARRGARVEKVVGEIGRTSTSELGDRVLDGLATGLAERLERAFDRRSGTDGSSVAILAPGVGGILAHEIVGHALEADTVRRGRSWLDTVNDRVAPDTLLILDDPRRGRAPWRIDDEGCQARTVALIRAGRVAGRLHDRRSARLAGVSPTGHGRRSGFRDPILPRMGCTFIAAGPHDPDELIGDVERGVYIRRMEAGSVDPRSGRAVFRVTEADQVVAGELGAPLSPFLWIVDGRRTLASVDRVACDLAFDTCIGSCHRESQALAIGVGAPTICIGVSAVSFTDAVNFAEG